jgi:signal transduction histidine kinase
MEKKKEQQLRRTYDTLISVAFGNGSISRLKGLFDDSFMAYGTTADEKVFGFEGIRFLIERQKAQLRGQKMDFARNLIHRSYFNNENGALFIEEFNFNIRDKDSSVFFLMRMSSILKFETGKWKFIHFHASTSDSNTMEGDAWPVEELKRKNVELEKQVHERTVDLQQKNRELEIEASLERVRASAMGMHKPGDLVTVCKAIYNEFRALGFTHIRNAQIAINNDARKSYLNYEYSDYGHQGVIEVFYNSHPNVQALVRTMKKSKDAFFQTEIRGKELNEWRKWRIKRGEAADKKLDKASTLCYYFYSVGAGALGISTFEKISPEELLILKKFRNVFELAYRRYVEIQNATAHVREAEIELALERVRARTMAMQRSQELPETSFVLFEQFRKLGLPADQITIGIFNEAKGVAEVSATVKGKILGKTHQVPLDEPQVMYPIYRQWKKKKRSAVVELQNEEVNKYNRFRNSILGKGTFNTRTKNKRWIVHVGCFSKGVISFSSHEPVQPEIIQLLERFAAVFDQTYIRFLDLQKAETQVREAQIEVAVERVRAKALSMHQSEEIIGIVETLWNEIVNLRIEGIVASTIYLKQDDGKIRLWDLTSVSNFKDGYRLEIDFLFKPEEIEPGLWINKLLRSQKQYTVLEESNFEKVFRWAQKFLGEKAAKVGKQFVRTNKIRRVWVAGTKLEKGNLSCDFIQPPPAEMEAILLKMGAAFDLAYKRFLDLKKAEAQAREAQIELGLERVRARAMAMQNSVELAELVATVFRELTQLGFALTSSIIWIHDHQQPADTLWIASAEMNKSAAPYRIRPFHEDFFKSIIHAWKAKDPKWVYTLTGNKKKIFEKAFVKELPNLPESLRRALIEPKQLVFSASFNHFGALEIVETEALTEEKFNILHRFGKVFDASYTRFNDLKKAEAQAREAQIEASLEKVRAQALGMHKPGDLLNVCEVLFKELLFLGFTQLRNAIIHDFNDEKRYFLDYDYSDLTGGAITEISYTSHPIVENFIKQIRSSDNAFAGFKIAGTELRNWKAFRKKGGQRDDPRLNKATALYYYVYSIGNASIGISTFAEVTEENLRLLKRFRNVFDFAYRRYMDVAQAEAQAKEARIEAALEKVRSRSLAMHKSSELQEVVNVVFDRLKEIGIEFDIASIATGIDNSDDLMLWLANKQHSYSTCIHLPPVEGIVSRDIRQAVQDGKDFLAKAYNKEEKNEWFRNAFQHSGFKDIPEERKQFILDSEHYALSTAISRNTYVQLISYEGKTISGQDAEILKRFSKVFEQSYIRFMDLQKAEAQARESEIELALERVRSRAMAMQHSEELGALIGTVFNELTKLNLVLTRSVIWIFDEKTGAARWWMANMEDPGNPMSFYLPNHDHPPYRAFLKAWKEKKKRFVYELKGKIKAAWDEFLFNMTELSQLPSFIIDGMKAPDRVLLSASFNNFGALNVASLEALSEEHFDIVLRFAKVFDLTYTRFNDLKQAEAQAREALIEAALERVRANVMAMKTSGDLNETSFVFGDQLRKLGIDWQFSYFWLIEEGTDENTFWITWPDHKTSTTTYSWAEADESFRDCLIAWQQQVKIHATHVPVQDVPGWLSTFERITHDAGGISAKIMTADNFRNGVYYYDAMIKFGSFGILTNRKIKDEEQNIQSRFAVEFERAYVRFLDLQKAEAQTREKEIELAVERVRAKALAMHKSGDISTVVQAMRTELGLLNLTSVSAVTITLRQEDDSIRLWDITIVDQHDDDFQLLMDVSFRLEDNDPALYLNRIWNSTEPFCTVEQDAADFRIMVDWLRRFDVKGANNIEHLLREKGITHGWHPAVRLSYGWLNVDSQSPPDAEIKTILLKVGAAFDLAYKRFLDLQKAEAQAREGQIQLALERVRARTMAMQKSDELPEAANLLFHQLQSLGMPAWSAGYCTWDDDKRAITLWMSSEGVLQPALRMPLTDDPSLMHFREAYERGETFFVEEVGGEALKEHYAYLKALPGVKETLDEVEKAGFPVPTFQVFHLAYFTYGFLLFITYEPVPESHDIFQRFGKVFDQTYTRFLDLKKAEAQAREAQIEASLERVRSRSMAMHKTDELLESAQLLFKELSGLGINSMNISYALVDESEKYGSYYSPNPVDGKIVPVPFVFPHTETGVMRSILSSWKRKESLNVIELDEKSTLKHQTYIGEHLKQQLAKKDIPFSIEEFLKVSPKTAVLTTFNFNKGYLFNIGEENLSQDHVNLLARFTRVFEQTYTRFLDLQKAEAQSREAQIELGLERVRARAMAMQSSNELSELVDTVFKELTKLDFALKWCIINIIDEPSLSNTVWAANPDINKTPESYHMLFEDYPFHHAMMKGWKERNAKCVYILEGPEKKVYDEYLFNETEFSRVPAEAQAASRAMEKYVVTFTFSNFGGLQTVGDEPLSDANLDILSRFGKVFDLTYTRFNDLKLAEAQAREAQIQLALERVRAKTMAMHSSEELASVIKTVYSELKKLDVSFERCFIMVFDEHKGATWWMASPDDDLFHEGFYVPYHTHPPHLAYLQGWAERQQKWEYWLEGQIKKDWDEFIFKETELSNLPPIVIQTMTSFASAYLAASFEHFGCVTTGGMEKLGEESFKILNRFAKVFDLSYTRFRDLQKAETQAREAQIEASLEKVRSASMAMHASEELQNVIRVLTDQLTALGFQFDTANFITNDSMPDWEIWISSPGVENMPPRIHVPYLDHILFNERNESIIQGKDFLIRTLDKKEKDLFFHYLFNETDAKFTPEERKRSVFERSGMGLTTVLMKNISLSVINFDGRLYTEEENQVIRRFASVFEQSYTRFLDLLKAEEQAREAQIEASLERVRAQTMAMHKSADLNEAVAVLFEQLGLLKLDVMRCGIGIMNREKRTADVWVTTITEEGPAVQVSGDEMFDIHPLLHGAFEAWLHKEDFSYVLQGEDMVRYYEAVNQTNFRLPQSQVILSVPDESRKQYYRVSTFEAGGLFAFRDTPFPEEAIKVMKRFAGVFELTYRRFLDIQKAEAQAKEATIEASLERVRSKAMAMHNSADLSSTVNSFFKELKNLGIVPIRCGVGEVDKVSQTSTMTAATASSLGDSCELLGKLKLAGHPVLENIFRHWERQEEYYPVLKAGDLQDYYASMKPQIDFPDYKEAVQYGSYFYFPEGLVFAWTEKALTEEELKIFRRLTTVVSLTYRRYIELQHAEENAKEAVKRAALDRIRAEIASMRTPGDLQRITPLIWHELQVLGIPFVRCGVFIMDDAEKIVHTYLSTPEGKAIAALEIPYSTPSNIREVISNWHEKKIYTDHWKEAEFLQFGELLVQQGVISDAQQYMETLPAGGVSLHFLPFQQGMLYVGNTTAFSGEEMKVLQSVADAFSTAYARYEDFNKLEAAKQQVDRTIVDLRQAQTQLIQSEKMASLGELTAGIAHEIQNPLNFVNNFSDVSNELLEEMKAELQKGNTKDAIAIVEDVRQNLSKILHHGRRADGIVKGMLQHSRTNSGQKEMTDLNVLADEYLRLSYHGLRAKDKTFSAKFETQCDSSIGKISIVPQDIGRVILNLINNAFYAVSEKKKLNIPGFVPTVTVSTKKSNGKVELVVADNGNGIPGKVLEKIFQPFFTTKPTGEGTGLGLSLSYDIITKGHGGELKVKTEEGSGTSFIIQLPVT